MNDNKPIILVSKCLGFAACRYNGEKIDDPFVESLRKYVTFIPLCPETEAGLGVPREPIRIVSQNGKRKIYQPGTGKYHTRSIVSFSKNFLSNLREIDGAILKSRSPSCGLRDVKIYESIKKRAGTTKGAGLFAECVMSAYPTLPVEDEIKLKKYEIIENFLTRIFINALFRRIKSHLSMKSLINFQNECKFLFLSYNEVNMRKLGLITANLEKKSVKKVILNYENVMNELLSKKPSRKSRINVLLHAFGFVSKKLSYKEKKKFLSIVEEFRNKKISLSVPCNLIRSLALRFDEKYLLNQRFLNPYPEELAAKTDLGKRRKLDD